MKGYRHLTQRQRFIIQDLRDLGKTKTEITEAVGVHRSSVSREIKRNLNARGGYRALGAETNAKARRPQIHDYSRKIQGALEELVVEKLNLRWSPEQISGRLKMEGSFSISHESIYNWIYKISPNFIACLRWKSKRRWRGHKKRRRGLGGLPRRSIEERSLEANRRLKIGHWERDLVEGKRSGPSLLVAVDRKSRYTKLDRVYSHSSDEICLATEKMLSLEPLKTLTNDNGVEFGRYKTTERRLGIPVYFTKPYTSWQRGTVENTNGLLRQFYPKSFDLWRTTADEIESVALALNYRPRKTLGYKTPYEVHFSKKQTLINSESTYRRKRIKRILESENLFWREFYRGEMRALGS